MEHHAERREGRCPPPCGKVRFRSEAHARRQIDAVRQACRKAGRPEPTWPISWYRCPYHHRWWHHSSDGRARDRWLRRNLNHFAALLAAA